jgi:hypothetical protein
MIVSGNLATIGVDATFHMLAFPMCFVYPNCSGDFDPENRQASMLQDLHRILRALGRNSPERIQGTR